MEPVEIVQASIDAYNANDLDATFEAFDPEVAFLDRKSGVQRIGLDAVRASYATFRAINPSLHYRITDRMALGEWVIDREVVTGLAAPREGEVLHAVIVYRVSDGRIREITVLS